MKLAGMVSLLAGFLLLAACNGGSPTHESVTKDMISMMEEQADILATITDEASFEAAKPKLDALKEKADTLKAATEKLGDPSKDVEEQLKKKYEPRVKEVSQKLMKEMQRLMMSPAIAGKLQEALKDLAPVK
jgi:hypothetical protein